MGTEKIWYDSEFVLKNLRTGVEKTYYLEEKVKGGVDYTVDNNGRVVPLDIKKGERFTSTGANIISSASPLGMAVLNMGEGSTIRVRTDKNNVVLHRVVKIISCPRSFSSYSYTGLSLPSIVALYNDAKLKGKILILRRDFWTYNFVFAVERIVGGSTGVARLVGKTFKNGSVYNSYAFYNSDAGFVATDDLSVQDYYNV